MVRTENEVFQDLAKLCTIEGYAHIVAYFCFRDNAIGYEDSLTAKDFEHQSSMERLIRTEISTLIGLMCKAEVSLDMPHPDNIQELINKTEALLYELHQTMMNPTFLGFQDMEAMLKSDANPFMSGNAMREPIFYSGESAYDFQYRELAFRKYANDAHWFEKTKGFSLADAMKMLDAVGEMHDEQLMGILNAQPLMTPDQWTFLPAYMVSSEKLKAKTNLSFDVVEGFLQAFSTKVGPVSNLQFDGLNAFNQTNAFPFIDLGGKDYLLFQRYSLSEAFYDTPFFWMSSDKSYVNEAMKNRGNFLEQYSAERLRSVFGQGRVFENVDIWGTGKQKVGEIDVLVIFANRAIVLQAKSKRLTLEARKGNDYQIKDDFKKSIQDSYDQGLLCAKCLNDPEYVFKDGSGQQLKIIPEFKEIYIFCVVSDHYPALSAQARYFLKSEETEVIKSPFVMDVFLLDVLCEMLTSPLYFLSYVNRRVGYADKVLSTHELVVLSYHLKQNLWVDEENSLLWLNDDISVDLDIAMMVRRTGAPGADTPIGILTRLSTSPVKRLLTQIEHTEELVTIDLGFLLLRLSGEALEDLGKSMDLLIRQANAQKNHHDLTLGVSDSGITIHVNTDDNQVSEERLSRHCEMRKYACKANTWFGLCINPENLEPRFGVKLVSPWEQSAAMDKATEEMSLGYKTLADAHSAQVKHKVGRNALCSCGSGKKFKKCCLDK